MIRDIRKDANYFKKYIAEEDARFNKYYNTAQQKSNEGNDYAAKRAYTFAAGVQKNKMIALYSAGAKLPDVLSAYENWVMICSKLPQLPYSELLLAASLCILLKPSKEIVDIVSEMLSIFTEDDIFIEGFKNYLQGKGFVYTGQSIKYDNFSKLKQIVVEPDNATQINKLITFTNKEWYSTQYGSAWYNSHLKDTGTYFGYWCFEGAALATALSLDTSDLKKADFIPDDLL